MKKQPVVFGKEDSGMASGSVPVFNVFMEQPQTTGKADQGALASNRDDAGLASSTATPMKSKVKTCLPADCTLGGTTVTLDNNSMWNEFYHRNTEMILTKQGRRMFPYCRYWITGLESNLRYILIMDISPVDNFRYKWNGHSWEPNGKAEPHGLGQVFIHPESPSTGHNWMHQPVSFYKLKLTDNTVDQEGHIILHSMHRYLPRLHLVPADKATEVIQLNGPDVHTFTFPQTEFFAVTAYQNIEITQLKTNYNPFVKGFRKDGLVSRSQNDEKKSLSSEQEGDRFASILRSSGEDVVLDPEQRDLVTSNSGWKFYNPDVKMESFYPEPDVHACDALVLKQEVSECPIASPCESDFHLKSLLNLNGDINISIKDEPADDYNYGSIVNPEEILVKEEKTDEETEEYFCRNVDPLLEKQLKKHNEIERKEIETESHKQPWSSLLHSAEARTLKLNSGTVPVACLKIHEVSKHMVKVSALQAVLSSCMKKKNLNHSVNSLSVHSENNSISSQVTAMETKIKNLLSGNREQKCSLVKDVPWKNPETYSNAIMKKASSSNCMPLASAKFIFGRKRTNAIKNFILSKGIDSNPNTVLSGPVRRGRPRKRKVLELEQCLKYPGKSIKISRCNPLGPDFAHPQFTPDLDNVDGILFASFASKEVLDNHTVDKSGGSKELPNVQAPLLTICDSDYQAKLHLLETKLLEDLKSFRHKQVIHPSLQEVGLKLGSVDPTLSIDLRYLGVQLPLNPSKDYVFGNAKGSSPNFQDTGLSFISRTGKTNDFRKIKGWKGKFHSASKQEGSISDGSLKNRSAFCSDKLDEYLETEGKLMETSIKFCPSCPVAYQLPSKTTSYVEALNSVPKNQSAFTAPNSCTFKPLSLSSVSRKRTQKTKNKQASSRGRVNSSSKFAVPSSGLSKQKYNLSVLQDKLIKSQPSSQVDDEEHVLVMSELEETVQGKHTPVCQAQQNSHALSLSKTLGKLMDLEYCALRKGKPSSYITEEHADLSLETLLISQVQVELMELENCALRYGKPWTYVTKERAELSLATLFTNEAPLRSKPVSKIIRKHDLSCGNDFCQLQCVCADLALEKCQATLSSKTDGTFDCLKKRIKGASKHKLNLKTTLSGILSCSNGQDDEWELEQNDNQRIINKELSIKEEGESDGETVYIPSPFATKPTKHVMLSHLEATLSFNKNKSTYTGVRPEQMKTPRQSAEIQQEHTYAVYLNKYLHFEKVKSCSCIQKYKGKNQMKKEQQRSLQTPNCANYIEKDHDSEFFKETCGTENDSEGSVVGIYLQGVVVSDLDIVVSSTVPDELMADQPENVEELTMDTVIHDKSVVTAETSLDHIGEELIEAPFLYPTDVILSDHSYVSKKPSKMIIPRMQNARCLESASDKVSEVCRRSEVLANSILEKNPTKCEEDAEFKSSGGKQMHAVQTQRPSSDSQEPKQLQLMLTAEQPQEQHPIEGINFSEKQQHGTILPPSQWGNQDNFELLGRHRKEKDDSVEVQGYGKEERREAEVSCAKDQNTVPGKKYMNSAQDLLAKRNSAFQENCNASSHKNGTTDIHGENQSIADNLVQTSKSQSVVKCFEQNAHKTNHCKNDVMSVIGITTTDQENNEKYEDSVEMTDGVSSCETENTVNVETLVKNTDQKEEFSVNKLEKKISHLQKMETMKLEVTMSDTKQEENKLPVNESECHSEWITCDRNAIISETAEKGVGTVEQLSNDAPIFHTDVVLLDHTYVLKVKAEKEKHTKLPESISDSISLSDESEDEDVDIESVEELSDNTSISLLKTEADRDLLSRRLSFRHLIHDHSDKVTAKSPKQLELWNTEPQIVVQKVAYRPTHTADERRRRGEMKKLFEKLKVTLGHTQPRVAKRILLKQAFEEIQELINQADKLTCQKTLLMRKKNTLIYKITALTGKSQKVVLKKLEYILAKQKVMETQTNQQHQEQSVKTVETVETIRSLEDKPASLSRENESKIMSNRLTKPLILLEKGDCDTENEDSFMMPRIVNVVSLAAEGVTNLNLDVNKNPHVALDADIQMFEHPLQVVPQEMTNFQSEEEAEISCGKDRDTASTEHIFLVEKENSFPQIVNVSSLNGFPESFTTELCIEELAENQAGGEQIDKGGNWPKAKDSSVQRLKAKEPRDWQIDMEWQKLASATQEAALNAGDLMDKEENGDTDETLTSLLSEIVSLNQQLNDNASNISELPNSLSSSFSLGNMESCSESAAAAGSHFTSGALDRRSKDLCLVQGGSGFVTPLLLDLEDDSLADSDRHLRDPSLEPSVLKLMPGSEANSDHSAINSGRRWKNTGQMLKTTSVLPPVLQMRTNLESDNTGTVWKPMPKLAPFGLKGVSFPLESGGQHTKVMPLLAQIGTKASSIGLKATQSEAEGRTIK
ncbi:MAX gene-associated protein-like isoform X2 [Hemicordylus capensis]|uniref:MAX gene-associated protein-like isoform X2 n=1 Tax=Hemicordylus capensis TaxID=884348 RepID=UPI002304A0FF|nr:MAX gene-associated protein-like isoform X2 [Hemicordylus capensis]